MRRIISRYAKRNIQDALMAQADWLIGDLDRGDDLSAPYPDQRLDELFDLAEQTRDEMPPVEPSEAFVADLKERLSAAWDAYSTRVDRQRETRRFILQIAGLAGLTLSGVAILALSVRLIVALLGRRRAARPV
ncbi:MAG: hypothetical protein JSV36_15450 [Anaerolineae bacterium]|nr:MAG: hypothetical protein JSV36_15450 [Anaerolineae bacterium]